jgi:hypothetical protein
VLPQEAVAVEEVPPAEAEAVLGGKRVRPERRAP